MTRRLERVEAILSSLLAEPEEARKKAIYGLIVEGEELVYAAEKGKLTKDEALAELHRVIDAIEDLSGERKEIDYFVTVHGGDIGDEAHFLAAPRHGAVSDLTASEIAVLLDATVGAARQIHQTILLDFLNRSLGKAFNTDLIYYPYAEWSHEELAVEIERRRALLAEGGDAALDEYELGIAKAILGRPDPRYWELEWAVPKVFPGDRALQLAEIRKRDRT